eukprot:1648491-Prymnesium_polylepis.1
MVAARCPLIAQVATWPPPRADGHAHAPSAIACADGHAHAPSAMARTPTFILSRTQSLARARAPPRPHPYRTCTAPPP